MTKIYSYVVEHDVGFAPNPFWGVCTLANCKPGIRRTAKVGDRIMGTGSKGPNLQGHLIYWMTVDRIISFDEYWNDDSLSIKKPVLNGSKMQHFGDNIYHKNDKGEFLQSDSFHSKPGGILSQKDLRTDTSKTENVLLGNCFGYFGKNAPKIPDELKKFVKKGPGHKNIFPAVEVDAMESWLKETAPMGIHGDPVRW